MRFGRTFLVKGVIEIIFIGKFSQNFPDTMMIAVAPHHWYVQPPLAFHISFGVGYCFILCLRQCEKPTYRMRQ